MVVDLLVEDLEKWFPRSLTQHVRITIIQSAAHILNTYDAKISDCKPQSLSLSLSFFPLRHCFVLTPERGPILTPAISDAEKRFGRDDINVKPLCRCVCPLP